MRRLLSIVSLVLLCGISAPAQDKATIAAQLTALADSCHLLIKYSYSDLSGGGSGGGIADVQQGKYTVAEDKTVIVCNGTTRWTMNSSTKEVYIENAGGSDDIFANLSAIVRDAQNLRFDGTNVSFDITFPGLGGKLRCKASIEKLPFNPDAKYAVEDGVLKLPGMIVTDLR